MQRIKEPHMIVVNYEMQVGIIKSLQGMNDGPLSEGGRVDLSSYYLDLGISHIRLHDVGFGMKAVDIHYVFPDMDADPTNPENYDFSQTDKYLEAINAIDAEIIYRLGYSWEAVPVHNIPPQNYEKWASICVQIAKHYNDGWADGYNFNITYWEIWNEPDQKRFWNGTAREYYELYEVTSRAIKAYDSSLKVGGPSISGKFNFLDGFLEYCSTREVPLDFVSWHIYSLDPFDSFLRAIKISEFLDAYDYDNVESLITEWNILSYDTVNTQIFETSGAAAFIASSLIYLQDTSTGIANFYRGDTAPFCGLFDRSGYVIGGDISDIEPRKPYYSFEAFRMLLDTPNRVSCTGSNDEGLAAIAGLSDDKQVGTILISNFNSEFSLYNISIINLPWKESQIRYEVYILDSTFNLERIESVDKNLESPSISILQEVEVPSVLLIRLIKN